MTTEITVSTFKGWLKKCPSHPKLMTVTPEIAMEGLTYKAEAVDENGKARQRPLSTGWVRELARRMKTGIWGLTPEPMAFDWSGHCLNGQHRLHAIIESGISIEAWVFFGQDPKVFAIIDGGKKRTAGDVFAMRGVSQSTVTAAIVRAVNIYHNKGLRGTGTGFPSAKTAEEIFDYYIQLGIDKVTDAVSLHGNYRVNNIPKPSSTCALFMVALEIDEELARSFFANLATGSNLGPRAIEKKLRDHLMVFGKDSSPKKISADIIRAWNSKRSKRRTFSTQPVDKVPEML